MTMLHFPFNIQVFRGEACLFCPVSCLLTKVLLIAVLEVNEKSETC